jgi:ceramide glucosyltransferase
LRQLVLIPVKDLVFGAAELQAFFTDEVEWRGTRLRVLPGSRLAPVEPVEESVAIARA